MTYAAFSLEAPKSAAATISRSSPRRRLATVAAASSVAARARRCAVLGWSMMFAPPGRAAAERTAELLSGYGISAGIIKGRALMEQTAAGVYIAEGSLASGFRLPLESIVIISEEEVFGPRVKRRAPPARKLEAFVQQIQDLSAGDFIVHRHHGIGRYMGLKRLVVDEVENDFLLIEYREGDKLYLPVSGVGLVTKYHGFEGQSPQLDRLGGTGWTRTKGRVKKAIEKMAGELLKLYAERQVARGFAFSGPTALFREFEAGFEYDETPDQARAIEEGPRDHGGAKALEQP